MNPMDWSRAVEENGFSILPHQISAEHVDRLLHEIGELSAPRSRAGVRHAFRLTAVSELARSAILLEAAREVLGVDAFPFRATLFDKSPVANWLVVWHQDTALPLRERLNLAGWGPWSIKEGVHYAHAPASALSHVLALRLHLDDSTLENGPLRILPRTHGLGVLSDDMLHELSKQISPVDCVVRRGGVLAMRPLLVHASSKSHSQISRRVLHIEYAASPVIARPLELATA